MSIADNLGMETPPASVPEDNLQVPIGLLFDEGGIWYLVYLTREEIKPLLAMIGTGGRPIFDNKQVAAVRTHIVEGPDCNLEFIYDFIIQQWRLE